MEQGRQVKKVIAYGSGQGKVWELVIPNPKLKLMDQVREVLRVKHYAIRTEQAYCDWIRRYVRFHGMRSREELFPGTDKVELFLSDLAVNLHVAASTQNQAFNALLRKNTYFLPATPRLTHAPGPSGGITSMKGLSRRRFGQRLPARGSPSAPARTR